MLANASKTKIERERGAVFLELALVLPLILAVMFIVIWMGLMLNAESSLTRAVGSSLRLGAVRGTPELTGFTIEAIDKAINFGGQPQPQHIEPLLVLNVDSGAARAHYNTITTGLTNCNNSPCQLLQLPEQYIYSLVYLKLSLRENLGRGVRYPCPPEGSNNDRGGGCVSCIFVDPANPWEQSPGSFNPFERPRRVAIDCRYQPYDFLTNSIYALFSMMGVGGAAPRIIITKTRVFDAGL